MGYTKTVWQNNITPIDETNMNNIENGIEDIEMQNTNNAILLTSLQEQLATLKTQEINNANLLNTLQAQVNSMQATTSTIANLVGVS